MIQLMPPFLDPNATHGKGDDHVSFFNEGIVEVAAVHACIRRSGNRPGRWIQTFDFGGHVLIGGGGQIHLFAGFVFEDECEIHGMHPLYILGLMMYNGNNRDVGSLRKIGI